MKNSADQGGYYPQRPKAEVDNTLRDLQNSSYPTKAEFNNCFIIHSKYFLLDTKNIWQRKTGFYNMCRYSYCKQKYITLTGWRASAVNNSGVSCKLVRGRDEIKKAVNKWLKETNRKNMGQKIPEDLPYVDSKSSKGLSQIIVWKNIDCCRRDRMLCIRLLKTLWEPSDLFFKFKRLFLSANFFGRIHFQINNEITQYYSRVWNRLDLVHTSFPLKRHNS